MKQCSFCGTTYTDDTLRYCLADGRTLVEGDGETATIVNQHAPTVPAWQDETNRVEIPVRRSHASQPSAAMPTATAGSTKSSGFLKALIALLILVIVGLLIIGGAGAFFYFRNGPAITSTNVIATPIPTPSAPANETDVLREQIANLERLIVEQKKTGKVSNVPLPMPNQNSTTRAARVNSPGDGFLALRSLPNSESGERIAKIPHGTTISIGGCGPVVRPVSRTGRWCQASYAGLGGWVFDAYLTY